MQPNVVVGVRRPAAGVLGRRLRLGRTSTEAGADGTATGTLSSETRPSASTSSQSGNIAVSDAASDGGSRYRVNATSGPDTAYCTPRSKQTGTPSSYR